MNSSLQPYTPRRSGLYKPIHRLGLYYEPNYVESEICKGGVVDATPRLYDPIRKQQFPLDRPPLMGEVQMGDVYDSSITKYGKPYASYADIQSGHIQYWNPEDGGEVYARPLFNTPSKVSKKIRITPMDQWLPEYPRQTTLPCEWKPCKKMYCDSFTHDSLRHREHLMEAQMRKHNHADWKYFHNNE